MKTILNSMILEILKPATEALEEGDLYRFSCDIHEDTDNVLFRFLNKYPPLPFSVCQQDLQEIIELLQFRNDDFGQRDWSPFEKVFYASLWKDARLQGLKGIIEGIQYAVDGRGGCPRNAIVYHYFGRHLVDRLNHPIIDQHSYRAFRMLNNCADDDALNGVRKIKSISSAVAAEEYCNWYRLMLGREKITCYEQSRKIDGFLFALGKYAKLP